MKISVMGIDYNHLLSGKALAEMGNEVTYISNDHKRIDNIKRGYYNADEAMVIRSLDAKENIGFSADLTNVLKQTNMCFISEGQSENEETQMEHVLHTAKVIGEHMNSHMFIVDRSNQSTSRVSQIKETFNMNSKKETSIYPLKSLLIQIF